MVAKRKDAPAKAAEAVQDTATGPAAGTPMWGAGAGAGGFSTDTASGQPAAQEPNSAWDANASADAEKRAADVAEQAETQTMPAEDTEAAKVKRSRKKAAADKQAAKAPAASETASVNTTELVRFVERIERTVEEIGALKQDVRDIFGEVKAKGYSAAILRKVLARRAMDDEKRKEQDALIDLYEEALR